MSHAHILPLLLCLGAGTVGGVFFAFSAFVMTALAQLPGSQGIAAMRRINVVVINPSFLGVFMGTAVLAVVAAVLELRFWSPPRSALILAASLSYVLGSFGVTALFNVPRNEQLARMEANADAALAYWPRYVREWRRWNGVRAAASLAAAACAAGALIY
jgi:uncharacterized membrane protein